MTRSELLNGTKPSIITATAPFFLPASSVLFPFSFFPPLTARLFDPLSCWMASSHWSVTLQPATSSLVADSGQDCIAWGIGLCMVAEMICIDYSICLNLVTPVRSFLNLPTATMADSWSSPGGLTRFNHSDSIMLKRRTTMHIWIYHYRILHPTRSFQAVLSFPITS